MRASPLLLVALALACAPPVEQPERIDPNQAEPLQQCLACTSMHEVGAIESGGRGVSSALGLADTHAATLARFSAGIARIVPGSGLTTSEKMVP